MNVLDFKRKFMVYNHLAIFNFTNLVLDLNIQKILNNSDNLWFIAILESLAGLNSRKKNLIFNEFVIFQCRLLKFVKSSLNRGFTVYILRLT